MDDRALVPLTVGLAARDAALDRFVLDDLAVLEVDQEQLAGREPPLALNVLRRDRRHTRLGGEHHVPLGVLHPATRAQAVAIEHRAGETAVGEHDRRRTVPRLHQAGVKVVEALDVGIEAGACSVGLGHHHHHRVRDRAAAEHQQLEHVVEDGRVRATFLDDWDHLPHVLAEELAGKLRLASPHPVDVPAQRVDLAVVGDHPVGMGERPARERVGRKTGVDERQPRGHARIAQVGEIARQLRRREHPLVDDRARGEARDRQLAPSGALDHAADHVQLALERLLVLDPIAGRHDHLPDHRCRQPRGVSDIAVVDWDIAPPERVLTLLLDLLLDQLLEHDPALGVRWQVADADSVETPRRQLDAGDGADEGVGNLKQDAGAIAGVGVRAFGAAMLEVLERVEGLLHDRVSRFPPELGDQRDTARVMLVRGVVETSGPGRS